MENNRLVTKTQLKKAKAVELWRETKGHISNICRALGINRGTFYLWLKNDPNFSTSLLDSESELNDDIREALIQKCADGDMTAIIFYLKSRHPDFKENRNIPTVAVQFNFGRGDDHENS